MNRLDRREDRALAPSRRWLLLLGLALGGACQNPDSAALGVRAVQFQDVVVPTGMRLRDRANESYSREEASWRMAHLVYAGQTTMEEALSYVRQRMPQHSWRLAGEETTAEASVKLRFERSIYRADYLFTRADGATVMVVDYTTDYSRR